MGRHPLWGFRLRMAQRHLASRLAVASTPGAGAVHVGDGAVHLSRGESAQALRNLSPHRLRGLPGRRAVPGGAARRRGRSRSDRAGRRRLHAPRTSRGHPAGRGQPPVLCLCRATATPVEIWLPAAYRLRHHLGRRCQRSAVLRPDLPRLRSHHARPLPAPDAGRAMSADVRNIGEIDRVVHEPGRLMIVALLFAVKQADFLYLQHETALNKGTLSSHLSRLEEAGYVSIEKTFQGKMPRTLLQLTAAGRTAFEKYRRALKRVL